MRTVGITGGIGSGKSTVCEVFKVLGIPVFHADDEAKRLMEEDLTVRKGIVEAFGARAYDQGRLDRPFLASSVFNDPASLARLNGIVHPAVRRAFVNWAVEQDAPYVVQEAAILVETGGHVGLDHLIVVRAPEQERIRRVMRRDGRSQEEVRARLRNQATDAERERVADSIVENDGARLVIPQVLAIHERLLAKH